MTALATMPSTEVATVVAERQASLPLTRDHPAQALAVLAPLRGEEQLARLTSFRPYRWVLPAWVVACVRLGRSADAEPAELAAGRGGRGPARSMRRPVLRHGRAH